MNIENLKRNFQITKLQMHQIGLEMKLLKLVQFVAQIKI